MPRKRFTRSFRSTKELHQGEHRFEHWYVDNQVYFITARCRDQFPAFDTEDARRIFWDRFDHHSGTFGFVPWVTSLMNNHYHTLGYLYVGNNLKQLMQRLHGSVAKRVNDLLPERRENFWRDRKGEEYFDGCIRDEEQCRRAYRYTLTQAERHRIKTDYREYADTHVRVNLEVGVKRALELGAFMEGVRYKRYEK